MMPTALTNLFHCRKFRGVAPHRIRRRADVETGIPVFGRRLRDSASLRGGHSRGRRARRAGTAGGLALGVGAVLLAGGVFVPASAAPAAPARAESPVLSRATGPAPRTTVVGKVGLRISLKVVPERVAAGGSVVIDLHLAASHATGALGYWVYFGDGTGRANPIPLYCLAGQGRPASGSWRFNHRYERAGTYKVAATGYVNCTMAQVVAKATIVVT